MKLSLVDELTQAALYESDAGRRARLEAMRDQVRELVEAAIPVLTRAQAVSRMHFESQLVWLEKNKRSGVNDAAIAALQTRADELEIIWCEASRALDALRAVEGEAS